MNRKRTLKSLDEKYSIAKEILSDIKTLLKKTGGNVKTISLIVNQYGHGAHPFGSGALPTDYVDYGISYKGGKHVGLGYQDVEYIGNTLCDLFDKEGIKYEKHGVYLASGNFAPDFEFPDRITMLAKPCKAWVQMVKRLKNGSGKDVSPLDLYSVDLCGKRSQYSESGTRRYGCFDEHLCANINAWVIARKVTRDTINILIEQVDDIDTVHSTYYETECYGVRHKTLTIEIQTPTGRFKGKQKFIF